jgi:hypothetical protein
MKFRIYLVLKKEQRMASSVTNVKIGVCSVTFKGTDLGYTKGGAVVTYEPDLHEVTVDRFGSTPLDKVLIGERLKVKVALAEWAIATLQALIPAASTGTTKTTLGGLVGDRMNTAAGLLVLHPVANAVGTRTEDVQALSKATVKVVKTRGRKGRNEVIGFYVFRRCPILEVQNEPLPELVDQSPWRFCESPPAPGGPRL